MYKSPNKSKFQHKNFIGSVQNHQSGKLLLQFQIRNIAVVALNNSGAFLSLIHSSLYDIL